MYDRFLAHAAKSRKMAVEDVQKIAGGRVWSGGQAVDLGLVDKIGGLDEALAMVAEEAGISDDDYEVQHMPRAKSFMDTFAQEMMEMRAMLTEPEVLTMLKRLGGAQVPLTMLWDALHNPQPTRVWAVMPTEIRIR